MTHFASLLLGSMVFAGAAIAGEGQSTAPLRDPWIPPGARSSAQSPQSVQEGGNVRAQVERKLRASFAAADTEGRGSITVEQARAAHLGFIVENFAAIDGAHTGRVSFEDVKRFLLARGARTL